PILERDEAVIEVGRRDRDVLAKPHRVVLVHPGVVARLGAPVLEPLEGRSWVLVGGKAFGTVVAGRARPVERTLALAPVEADERAVLSRTPKPRRFCRCRRRARRCLPWEWRRTR